MKTHFCGTKMKIRPFETIDDKRVYADDYSRLWNFDEYCPKCNPLTGDDFYVKIKEK